MNRIAFISTAHIHSNGFLTALNKEIDSASCAAIWDDVPARGQQYAEKFGVPFVADLERVLSDASIDGFVVCCENTRHLPLLEKVLPVGKPTFCEKPLATNVRDAERIVELQRRSGTKLVCGYFHPFGAEYRGVRAMMDRGEFGKVTHVRYVNAHHAAYGRWFDSDALKWFTQPELSGGGALMDMGTHAVHLLLHFCGPAKRVWARIDNVTGEYPAVDDYGTIEIEFANGIKGRAEAGWCFTGDMTGLSVIGSRRSCVKRDALEMHEPGKKTALIEKVEPRPDRMRRLVAAVRGELSEQELEQDLRCAVDAVAVMETAYKSARSGRWEDVPTVSVGG
jgi:predicted dehydrogenase